MTQNQIRYWEHVENVRSNKVREAENYRHNTVTERETTRHNVSTEGETHRHNVVSEAQTDKQLSEIARHNRASENISYGQISLGYSQLAETSRHNKQQELLTDYANREISRHNTAVESETNRTNVVNEGLKKYSNYTGRLNTTSNMVNDTLNTSMKLVTLGRKRS